MITPAQIRAARALLGITQAQLATGAGISTTGLVNIERGTADPKVSTLGAVQAALEREGATFISSNSEGPGVRLTASSREPVAWISMPKIR